MISEPYALLVASFNCLLLSAKNTKSSMRSSYVSIELEPGATSPCSWVAAGVDQQPTIDLEKRIRVGLLRVLPAWRIRKGLCNLIFAQREAEFGVCLKAFQF